MVKTERAEGKSPDGLAYSTIKRAVEWRKDLTTEQNHREGVGYINGLLVPLLDALSVPETSLFVPSGKSVAQPYIRRSLMYAPEIDVNGKPYTLHVTQGIQMDGTNRGITVETFDDYDDVRLFSVGPQSDFPFDTVRNERRQLASKSEIEGAKALAEYIAREAPEQAMAKDRISTHWMERYFWTEPSETWPKGTVSGLLLGKEDYPLRRSPGKPRLFEVIASDLVAGDYILRREVARRGEDTNERRDWIRDLTGATITYLSDVIAWREVWDPHLPEYYVKEKYPELHRPQAPQPERVPIIESI